MGLPTNAVAENVLGTIGAVCWSVQLIPQVYKSWKLKNTAGLSSWMLAIWWAGGIFLGTYVVVQNINIPLIVQPQAFGALSIVCWMQCVHYDQGKSWKFAISMGVGAVVLAGGAETALIFGARAAIARGHDEVLTMAGVVSAILIAGGLLPQYWEIYKFKAVKGISLIFLLIDLAGGVFSFLSLVFAEGEFDTLASISYGAVVFLEVGIMVLAAILNPRYNRKMAEAKRIDEEALSGTPSPALVEGDVASEKKGADLQAPEMRGRSREVVGKVWRSDSSLERMEAEGGEEIDGVRRPDSAERKRQESVARVFRS